MQKEISRRSFLTGAAVMGGAATLSLAGCASQRKSSDAEAQAAPAGEGDEIAWGDEADIVIVGAGGGGLAAAYTSALTGGEQDVLVLEVMPDANMSDSALCAGMIQAACTRLQKDNGIDDSVEDFDKLLEACAEGFEDPELRRLFAEESGKTVDWLCDLGVEFGAPSASGTAAPYYTDITPNTPRTVTCATGGGGITSTPKAAFEELGGRFTFDTQATELVLNAAGEVIGVKALVDGKETAIKARKGIVLATGGFTRNKEMIKRYMTPMLTHMKTDALKGVNEPILASGGSPWQQGDGINMGLGAGAQLSCMMFPYAFGVGIRLNREDNSGSLVLAPGIYVNSDGKRFCFETQEPRENVVTNIWKQKNGVAFAIFDQALIDRNASVFTTLYNADFNQCVEDGYILQADTLDELAKLADIPAANLQETIEQWNVAVEKGKDEFGRIDGTTTQQSATPPMAMGVAPWYIAQVGACCQDTASGLAITTNFEVKKATGGTIPRLYAVGNTTGGVKGRINVGCGQGIGWTVTGGRLVGPIVSALEPWE